MRGGRWRYQWCLTSVFVDSVDVLHRYPEAVSDRLLMGRAGEFGGTLQAPVTCARWTRPFKTVSRYEGAGWKQRTKWI